MDLIGEEQGWLTRTAEWLDASRAELVGLAVLLGGVVLTTGVLLWSAVDRPDLPPAADAAGDDAADVGTAAGHGTATEIAPPDGNGAGGQASDGTPPGPGDAHAQGLGQGDGAASAREVTVHVAGHVARPGVVTLAAGARVADALDAAGGATDLADLTRINLARPLVDGEHVRVVSADEDAPPPHGPAGGDPAGPSGETAGPVDINRATAEELQRLPGIGPALAERIVRHRETHGPFRQPGDLRDVSGIGETRFQDLADLITVG